MLSFFFLIPILDLEYIKCDFTKLTTNKSSTTGKQKQCKKKYIYGNITCEDWIVSFKSLINKKETRLLKWTGESTMHCMVRRAIYTTHTHTHTHTLFNFSTNIIHFSFHFVWTFYSRINRIIWTNYS